MRLMTLQNPIIRLIFNPKNPMTTTLTHDGIAYDVEYEFEAGYNPRDRDEQPIGDHVEAVKVTIRGGQDDISPILAEYGVLPDIEQAIADKL